MRTLGIIILIIGIILGIYALSMDTSVQVNYNGDSFGLPDRVNNLGLMNQRQNYIITAGILSIIGTIILIFKKSDSNENDSITTPLENVENKDELSKGIIKEEPIKENPFETLNKLKESGLITNFEYEEKLISITNQIEQKEKEDELNTWTRIINNRTDKKAQPFLELALKAKNGGLISEQEYEAKKKEIIDKCLNEIEIQDASINKESYHNLSQPKKDKVEMYLETISNSELIVLHHNKIKVIDDQRWQEIINENIADNFEVIYQNA